MTPRSDLAGALALGVVQHAELLAVRNTLRLVRCGSQSLGIRRYTRRARGAFSACAWSCAHWWRGTTRRTTRTSFVSSANAVMEHTTLKTSVISATATGASGAARP